MRLLPHLPNLSPDQRFDTLFLATTMTAGLIEEMAKFAVVLSLFAWRKELDEPVDALIYATVVAMGFSAGEDYLRHCDGVEWARFFNPPGHAMFSSLWGYGMGMYLIFGKIEPLVGRLVLSVVVHGLWDALSIYREIEGRWWVAPMIFAIAFGLFWMLERNLGRLQDPELAAAMRQARHRWQLIAGYIPRDITEPERRELNLGFRPTEPTPPSSARD
jgi:RsiW-degrading membrane proteinase PrsW (M82 family)